ncbi:hypothetical protein NGRA_1030 [Nosema granulosis]|uniref:Uncharacterized protein n=1 Tax=Nosema granulosis TaxID=83296 RepID=A0A9P6GZT6_9MICR|nr:hypothetical protein NGRA_1030 [Nosema granulosis]
MNILCVNLVVVLFFSKTVYSAGQDDLSEDSSSELLTTDDENTNMKEHKKKFEKRRIATINNKIQAKKLEDLFRYKKEYKDVRGDGALTIDRYLMREGIKETKLNFRDKQRDEYEKKTFEEYNNRFENNSIYREYPSAFGGVKASSKKRPKRKTLAGPSSLLSSDD